MSADNGIFLLKTPTENSNSFEYRVIHAQAIENIYYDPTKPHNHNPEGVPEAVVDYFGQTKVFLNVEEAWKEAFDMEAHVLSDDFCPILEYGVCSISLPHPFSWYELQYNKWYELQYNKR